MKAMYNKPIYEGSIRECGGDRPITVSKTVYMSIPVGTNYVVVNRMPFKRSRRIEVYYQRWLPGADGPEQGFGYDSFSDGLRERVIKELKNLKIN